MKKLLLAIAVCSISAITASAQQPDAKNAPAPHKSMHHHRRHTDLAQQLNFSDEQKHQWQSIKQDFRKKMTELNKQENITVKEMRDKKASLIKEQRTAFQDLLTAEQKSKLQELKNKSAEKRQQMAAKRLDKMKTTLGLSDEQTAKIKDLDNGFHEQLKKFHDDQSLSRTEKKDQLTGLMKQHKQDIQAVLTPEQQSKLEALRQERKDKSQRL